MQLKETRHFIQVLLHDKLNLPTIRPLSIKLMQKKEKTSRPRTREGAVFTMYVSGSSEKGVCMLLCFQDESMTMKMK